MQEVILRCDVRLHSKKRATMEKETKTKYFLFFDKTGSLLKVLEKRERRKAQQTESENLESKDEKNEISTRNARKAKAVVR